MAQLRPWATPFPSEPLLSYLQNRDTPCGCQGQKRMQSEAPSVAQGSEQTHNRCCDLFCRTSGERFCRSGENWVWQTIQSGFKSLLCLSLTCELWQQTKSLYSRPSQGWLLYDTSGLSSKGPFNPTCPMKMLPDPLVDPSHFVALYHSIYPSSNDLIFVITCLDICEAGATSVS